MLGQSLVKPSDFPSAVAQTASKTPEAIRMTHDKTAHSSASLVAFRVLIRRPGARCATCFYCRQVTIRRCPWVGSPHAQADRCAPKPGNCTTRARCGAWHQFADQRSIDRSCSETTLACRPAALSGTRNHAVRHRLCRSKSTTLASSIAASIPDIADAAGTAERYTGEFRRPSDQLPEHRPRVPGFQAIGRSGLSWVGETGTASVNGVP